MTNYRGELKPLTNEEARVTSEDFLWNSKIWERHSFNLVEEYIENQDKALTNTKYTTFVLGKGGNSFFTAHVEGSERY